MAQTFVIIGGGLAGVRAAEAAREAGYDGAIVVVAAELELPYNRPPLSKGFLRGEESRGDIVEQPRDWWSEHDVELREGVTATALDLRAGRVELADGSPLAFDHVLLATGSEPRRLRGAPELEGVHVLRTVADSEALREALQPGRRVGIVGASWIGCEVAASARQRGAEVVLMDPLELPLQRVLGRELGALFRDLHAGHGVDLRLGSGVDGLLGDGRVSGVRLEGGDVVECDAVVVGIGVAPRLDLAREAGLAVEDGIVVDGRLRASDARVLAAGDIANVPYPALGERLRVEHWAAAYDQGALAGRSLVDEGASWQLLPFFYSDQYDLGMEYRGHHTDDDQVVLRGDVESREVVAFWLRDGRVVAGANVNVWDVGDDVEALIRSGRKVDAGALADPGTALGDL
jgi:3-phenylpropionate/trans-cinnamate dioxygenase ferredoxin reductase subunit